MMAGLKVLLAFGGSVGLTFVILACALPGYNVWWPFTVVIFYVLTSIATIVVRRCHDYDNEPNTNVATVLAVFLTMGCFVSSFALPIVLARSPDKKPVIEWGACYLTIAGNIVVYLTMLGYCSIFEPADVW